MYNQLSYKQYRSLFVMVKEFMTNEEIVKNNEEHPLFKKLKEPKFNKDSFPILEKRYLLKNGYRRCGMYGFTGLYGIIRESGSLGFRDLYVS